jgi:hypothetical protein
MAAEFQYEAKVIQNPNFEHNFDTVCTSSTFAIGSPTVTLPDGPIIGIAAIQSIAHSLFFPILAIRTALTTLVR